MSLRLDIRRALELHVIGTPGFPAAQHRAWEAVLFSPPAGADWARIAVEFQTSAAVTFGDTPTYEHSGLFLVDLHTPFGQGPAAVDALADAVIARFQPTAPLQHGGVVVRPVWATRSAGRRDGAYWLVPVTVRWRVFSRTP